MSKQDVGRASSIFVTNVNKVHFSNKCAQSNHKWCSGRIRIKNKDERLNEKISELRQQYNLSEKALMEEALIILKKTDECCQCFCHKESSR